MYSVFKLTSYRSDFVIIITPYFILGSFMFQTQLLEKLIFLPKVLSETEIYQEKKIIGRFTLC